MDQMTFSEAEYQDKKRKPPREIFLERMGKLIAEELKASVLAKLENPFRYIKQVFRYRKILYRGLAKNASADKFTLTRHSLEGVSQELLTFSKVCSTLSRMKTGT